MCRTQGTTWGATPQAPSTPETGSLTVLGLAEWAACLGLPSAGITTTWYHTQMFLFVLRGFLGIKLGSKGKHFTK